MSLNNDTPISGLPDTVQDIGLNDLLAISQKTGADQYFTARITVAAVYALFISDINISDVKLLATRLASMQEDIDSKLSGAHTHVIGEVTGLQIALDNKAASTHSHAIGQISGLQAALDSKLDTLTHTHSISQVSGLQLALNQRAALNHSHAIGDVTGLITALSNKLETNLKGMVNGLAELDSVGRVPKNQSHLFIIEKSTLSNFPPTGESGKYYIAANTGISYRWDSIGEAYTPLSTGVDYLELGETSTTAYRGDRGKLAYQHSQVAHAPADAQKNVQADWSATSGDAFIRNKPAAMAPLAHAHSYSEINGLKPPTDAQKNVQADWLAVSGDAFIKNKPTTMPPTAHTHAYSSITGTKPAEDAQKNSDITKAEIEAVLTGEISSHNHNANYLLTTGGTLTGALNCTNDLTADNLTLNGGSNVTTISNEESFISSISQTEFNTNNERFIFNKDVYWGAKQGGTNGYTSLPNGFILQWVTASADGTWPITFPNGFFGATGSFKSVSNAATNTHVGVDGTVSGFSLTTGADNGGPVFIMAIGH